MAEPGFIADYVTGGRNVPLRAGDAAPDRPRHRARSTATGADWIRSEALLRLDFGKGRLPGMLVLRRRRPAPVQARRRAPTCWPSSPGSSSGRCGAGWRDRAWRSSPARRRTRWRDWLTQLSRAGRRRATTRSTAYRARRARAISAFLAAAPRRRRRAWPLLAAVPQSDLRAWMAHERGRGLSARSLARAPVGGARASPAGWPSARASTPPPSCRPAARSSAASCRARCPRTPPPTMLDTVGDAGAANPGSPPATRRW